MSDVIALQLALPLAPFAPSSRYAGIEIATMVDASGQMVVYVRRRFVPQPEQFSSIGEHMVASGERLDNIAALYFGDPELFWRICDANRALRPEELTETAGRRLLITLPQGVQGAL
jgi:hypothetical protein